MQSRLVLTWANATNRPTAVGAHKPGSVSASLKSLYKTRIPEPQFSSVNWNPLGFESKNLFFKHVPWITFIQLEKSPRA